MIDIAQLALQRTHYPQMTDDEFRFYIQQVDGRQRTEKKLPSFYSMPDYWYPVRLSLEQSSSERTAKYKAELLSSKGISGKMVDLTAGMGVDDYFLSYHFEQVDSVEQDEELCRLLEHNAVITNRPIRVHHMEAEKYLNEIDKTDLIYIDPARRNKTGSKVFLLEDCSPNVVALLPTIRSKSKHLMLKLSPMLDITKAWMTLGNDFDVYVVALDGEVKEVLMLSGGTQQITTIDLSSHSNDIHAFPFNKEEEQNAILEQATEIHEEEYLLEPSAALLKAGAFHSLSAKYHIPALGINTHLYVSKCPVPNWIGRQWRIRKVGIKNNCGYSSAHVLTRNFPLSPTELMRKLRVKEGGDMYILGTRVGEKTMIALLDLVKS